MKELYERVRDAAGLRSQDGAVRITAAYEPLAGEGAPVFPPTVKADGSKAAAHLCETRYVDGRQAHVVFLDQRQSQANRCEAALLQAAREGSVSVPYLELQAEALGRKVRLTSLDAPHRSRDAYFRDAVGESGEPFDKTPAGLALRDAAASDMSDYLRLVPTDLVYGVWDSHRKRRVQVKVPRAYTSEMIGIEPLVGARAAGRVDQLNLAGERVEVTGDGWKPLDSKAAKDTEKPAKGAEKPAKSSKIAKLSELGHGMIPPTESTGGVSVTSVRRTATLSMAQLAALRFGDRDGEFTSAARALLACLALLGDRLAFAAPALRLRSGCDLVMVEEQVEWVGRGSQGRPVVEALELSTVEQALELFAFACARAREVGVEWAPEPVVVRPGASLQQAIEQSFAITGIGEAEGE